MAARGDTTRDKLVEATIRLVGEVGYAHTTTRAIARSAGVAEGTIYRHFPDKAALFTAAILRQHAPITQWVARLPALAGQRSVAENLTECLQRLSSLRESVLPLELALLTDPELAQQSRRPEAPPRSLPGPPEMLAAYLEAEQALGRIRPELDPRQVAILLLVTLFGLAVTPPGAPGAVGRPSIHDAVRILLTGIATPGHEHP
jgi:AcrR family transcriptional regulator